MLRRLHHQGLVLLLLVMVNPLSAYAETITLDTFQIEDFKGELVYLDFWASWCKPCKASFPWMNKMQDKYSGQLNVVAVNLDPEREDADRFLEKYPAVFPIVYDPDGKLAEKYEIMGMPTSILFDRAGNILFKHTGFKKAETKLYEKKIEDQLTSKN